ncbi:hypothetical protein, partial [Novosphingobium sp. CCH12-A3]|uniref:hypothetical protein n=1 Tax=Novosphingobium sp. CCH12-A3 TaxID=1768752 RepID=UPI001E534EA4
PSSDQSASNYQVFAGVQLAGLGSIQLNCCEVLNSLRNREAGHYAVVECRCVDDLPGTTAFLWQKLWSAFKNRSEKACAGSRMVFDTLCGACLLSLHFMP